MGLCLRETYFKFIVKTKICRIKWHMKFIDDVPCTFVTLLGKFVHRQRLIIYDYIYNSLSIFSVHFHFYVGSHLKQCFSQNYIASKRF